MYIYINLLIIHFILQIYLSVVYNKDKKYKK